MNAYCVSLTLHIMGSLRAALLQTPGGIDMKAKIKLEIKGKVIELELEEAKELAKVLANMTGVKIEKIIEHHNHHHEPWYPNYWYGYSWWSEFKPITISDTAGTYECQISDNITAELSYSA